MICIIWFVVDLAFSWFVFVVISLFAGLACWFDFDCFTVCELVILICLVLLACIVLFWLVGMLLPVVAVFVASDLI